MIYKDKGMENTNSIQKKENRQEKLFRERIWIIDTSHFDTIHNLDRKHFYVPTYFEVTQHFTNQYN